MLAPSALGLVVQILWLVKLIHNNVTYTIGNPIMRLSQFNGIEFYLQSEDLVNQRITMFVNVFAIVWVNVY